MIEQRLNQEVLGIESKYLVFGGAVVAGSFALLVARVVTWDQVAPLVTLIAGHYFGRRSTSDKSDGKGEDS